MNALRSRIAAGFAIAVGVGLVGEGPLWLRACAAFGLGLATALTGLGHRPPTGPGEDVPAAPTRVVGSRLPRLATFRGRRRELAELTKRYHNLREPEASNGAIILAIHGMPGVGKSALARELALELAGHFPDGQLYANLGNAGNLRPEAEILQSFITALRPDMPVPTSTVDRAALFRSLTATGRLLVVLDAARDHEQVARLMPAGEGCAVIVTGRRNLGPALGVRSLPLGVPGTDDAIAILRAVSGTAAEDEKFAIEIVDRLGRLPLAIRAFGDVVVHRLGSLPPAARRLRVIRADSSAEDGPHLAVVRERVESEYARLDGDEQLAFRALALIESPSFVPWVLAPLLNLDGHGRRPEQQAAERTVSRLAERQLLELAGSDPVTGLDRYRLHPLYRAFAESLPDDAGALSAAALARVDDAYLEALDLIFAKAEPGYRERNPLPERLHWFGDSEVLSAAVDGLPERWVRAEYRNLLRCVAAAHARGRFGLCWRLAVHLGASVADEVLPAPVEEAFALGLDAAGRVGDEHAAIRVELARGWFLGRLGRYRPDPDRPEQDRPGVAAAYEGLDRAAARANRLPDDATQAGPRLEAEALHRLAAVHLHHGAYRDAAHVLARAAQLCEIAGDKDQQHLVAIMRAAAEPDRPLPAPTENPGDEAVFWRGWVRADRALAEGRWRDASQRLHRLREHFADDASRVAVLLGRLAECRLTQLRADPETEPERSRERAVHRAAEALYRFQRITDLAGAARARCALVRALVAADRADEAALQFDFAREEVGRVEPLLSHECSPLQAALAWAEGELLRRHRPKDDPAGENRLLRAALLFHVHGDRQSEAGALRGLDLDLLPDNAFEQAQPGRPTDVWIESPDDTLRPDRPFTVCYRIGPPALTRDLPPAGARRIEVILHADGGRAVPAVHALRLDPWAGPPELRFDITPDGDAPHLQVLVYDADEGALLRRTVVSTVPRTGAVAT
ncbi:NB-ARC domain-containing protein [Dactylosporangium sp. NPDC049140]|uniref:NB-ARC domain-containing protein n=1 Tax=Dactylosporangium sp. NPDC049140 TaxID=3155647 RepID=UPI0033DAF552